MTNPFTTSQSIEAIRQWWSPAIVTLAAMAALMAITTPQPADAAARQARPERTTEATASRDAGEPIMAIVSIKSQKVTFYDADGWILRAPVSTGTKGRETPAGVFSVVQKDKDHHSSLYDDAWMPNMLRITWNGIALHGGPLPGYAASHGCVRMPFGFAEKLFDKVRIGTRIIVSPLAARMAADAGINLRTMQGSGPGGRIVKRDIESAVADAKSQHVAAPTTSQVTRPTAPVQLPEIAEASPFRDEPTTEMRRTIARRLVTSIGPVPHFFLTTEIEMDKAAEFRSSLAQIDPNLKVSFNDIVIKVVANSLIKHPAVNASFQDRSIRYYERADIGVAVAVEDGLITPIIRSADKKSIVEIGMEIKEKAERARTRKLRPEEYLGATFSVSNLGMFGIDEFTAIINPPEAAILAVGAIKPVPVVRNNEIVVRQMMHVTMSCDHRVVDGATGAKFLQTVKRTLENPLLLLV